MAQVRTRAPVRPGGSAVELLRLLEASRRQDLVNRMGYDLLYALILAAIAFATTALAEWVTGRGAAPEPGPGPLTVALLVLAGGLVAASARAIISRPPLEWYARRIDEAAELPLTITTALELTTATIRVDSALVREHTIAAALAALRAPSSVRRPPPRRPVFALLWPVMAAVGLAHVPAVVTLPERPSPSDLQAFATALQEVAGAVLDLAESPGASQYLQSIANEFQVLVAEVNESKVTADAATERFEELMSHVRTALAGDAAALDTVLDSAGAAQSLVDQRAQERARDELSGHKQEAMAQGGTTADSPLSDGGSEDSGDPQDLGHLDVDAERRDDGTGGPFYAENILEYDPNESEYAQELPEIKALREALEHMNASFAMPVGEADGEEAGVFSNDDAAVPDGIETAAADEEMRLPTDTDASVTTRVDAPVVEDLIAVLDGSLAVGAWRREGENVVGFDALPAGYREFVQRYFTYRSEGPGLR